MTTATSTATQAESFTCPKCGRVAIKELHFCAAPTNSTPTVTKRIGRYDPDSHDFPAYVIHEDGSEEYVGSRPTQHDASLLASDYITQLYSDSHTPEKAAELIRQELEQEGRHEQFAADQGMAWEAMPLADAIEADTYRAYSLCSGATDPAQQGEPSGDPEPAEPPNGAGMWMAKPCFERVKVVAPVCPECGKADCPGSTPEPAQSGLCWCVTWMAQGHAGECPDCRWRGLNTPAARVNWSKNDTVTTECAMCYSLQSCYDDGEAFICIDRAACKRRQAENCNPLLVNNIAAKLSALREECRAALAAGLYVQANSAKDKAACIAELYVSAVDAPVVVEV